MDNSKKPLNGDRRPPADMPNEVATVRRRYDKPLKRDTLPRQKALTDEPEQKPPAKWKAIAKKILIVLALLIALAFLYLFLLLGEPDEDDEMLLQQTAQEAVIQIPMTGQEMAGTVDIPALAVSFGEPVMQLRVNQPLLQKAALYDTAYHGGYARRLTLTYQFPDNQIMTIDSIRPSSAIELLQDKDYSIRFNVPYTMSGLDAVRMDSETYIRVAAQGTGAAYVVHIPLSKENQLSDLLRYTGLVRLDEE